MRPESRPSHRGRASDPFADEWVERLGAWLAEGASPYLFLHTPSNVETPGRLRELRNRLGRRTSLAELAPFPGEQQESAAGQLSLFPDTGPSQRAR